jgi:hypothetical protein
VGGNDYCNLKHPGKGKATVLAAAAGLLQARRAPSHHPPPIFLWMQSSFDIVSGELCTVVPSIPSTSLVNLRCIRVTDAVPNEREIDEQPSCKVLTEACVSVHFIGNMDLDC